MPRKRCQTAVTLLVQRAQSGDQAAFGELVRRYRTRIVALALHLTGSASDAEDVTQEVFLRAYRALNKFEGRSQFFTWIYRMGVNLSLNARRDRKRRRETLFEDDPRIGRAIAVDAPNHPGRAAELRETYRRLLGALDRLPKAMRTTVVLVSLQGLSHREVAEVLDCSQGTVAWRMHEARRRLAKSLQSKRRADTSKTVESMLMGMWNWAPSAP